MDARRARKEANTLETMVFPQDGSAGVL